MDAAAPVGVSYHTLSGTAHGQRPKWTLLQRATAAKAAGFTHIGASSDDVETVEDIKFFDRHLRFDGVQVNELEWLSLNDDVDRDKEDLLFAMADTFGAKQLNIGWCAADLTWSTQRLEGLVRRIAQRAADHGVSLAFEPVAFGALGDIEAVQQIIGMAGEPNVGTLLDVYHLARANWYGEVDKIDPATVTGIQVCGVDLADPQPTYPDGLFYEAQHARRLPGAGDFPLADWLADLAAKGVDAPISIEVMSDDLNRMNCLDAAMAVGASWQRFTTGLTAPGQVSLA